MTQEQDNKSVPWWKFGHVWMVIAGPVIVVIASVATFYIAHKGMDPVLDEDYYRKGVELNRTLADNPASLAPAVKARNHAQTGVQEKPKAP
jgi:hypothetical protein